MKIRLFFNRNLLVFYGLMTTVEAVTASPATENPALADKVVITDALPSLARKNCDDSTVGHYTIATGDLNGDGKPDAAVALQSHRCVALAVFFRQLDGKLKFHASKKTDIALDNEKDKIENFSIEKDGLIRIDFSVVRTKFKRPEDKHVEITYAHQHGYRLHEGKLWPALSNGTSASALSASDAAFVSRANERIGMIHSSPFVDHVTEPFSFAQGDLNGDGLLDVATLFVIEAGSEFQGGTGGNWSYVYLTVFIRQPDGSLKLIKEMNAGGGVGTNRATNASIKNGLLHLDILRFREGDAGRWPSVEDKEYYLLQAGNLIKTRGATP